MAKHIWLDVILLNTILYPALRGGVKWLFIKFIHAAGPRVRKIWYTLRARKAAHELRHATHMVAQAEKEERFFND